MIHSLGNNSLQFVYNFSKLVAGFHQIMLLCCSISSCHLI
uniref:Uncharacterized protein n=1 Tax=Rhizophora mucronata TaxID=61149 RepID=A0A2P2R346_RHIMU